MIVYTSEAAMRHLQRAHRGEREREGGWSLRIEMVHRYLEKKLKETNPQNQHIPIQILQALHHLCPSKFELIYQAQSHPRLCQSFHSQFVSEVLEGDSSGKVIEMIFRSGWTSFENRARIERILKVHNPQTKLAQFEEY